MAGTFTWAGAGVDPIEGRTDQDGLFSTRFQTVVQMGVIGGPAGSRANDPANPAVWNPSAFRISGSISFSGFTMKPFRGVP